MTIANPLTVFRGDYRYLRRKQEVACLTSDSVGDPVYIRDTSINGKWRVEKANPEDEAKMPAIGIMIEKSTPTVGVIQVIGPCDIFSGMTPNTSLFVGVSGLVTTPPIIGGSGYSMVQKIGHVVAEDLIWIVGSLDMTKRQS